MKRICTGFALLVALIAPTWAAEGVPALQGDLLALETRVVVLEALTANHEVRVVDLELTLVDDNGVMVSDEIAVLSPEVVTYFVDDGAGNAVRMFATKNAFFSQLSGTLLFTTPDCTGPAFINDTTVIVDALIPRIESAKMGLDGLYISNGAPIQAFTARSEVVLVNGMSTHLECTNGFGSGISSMGFPTTRVYDTTVWTLPLTLEGFF